MNIKIATVEDSQQDRTHFNECLEEISKATQITFSVDSFSSGEEFLSHENNQDYQIVFLDIELPKMNGMETAKEFRKTNTSTILIFLTNYIQYAVDGYEVNAFDYILKPLNYYSFYMKFQRVIRKLSMTKNMNLKFNTNEGIRFINTTEIRYIEIMGHNLVILTNEGNIESVGILNTLEKELKNYDFSRCSASSLINMSYIQGIYGDKVILKTGESIHIGRTKKKQFLNDVALYIGKGNIG